MFEIFGVTVKHEHFIYLFFTPAAAVSENVFGVGNTVGLRSNALNHVKSNERH